MRQQVDRIGINIHIPHCNIFKDDTLRTLKCLSTKNDRNLSLEFELNEYI